MNNIKKTLGFFMVLSSLSLEIFAQSNFNLQKYWYYKNRLNNYFVQVGPNPGESLVAQDRSGESIGYSDELDHLGWYIGTLATEYALLDNNQQDNSETIKELFYALYAVNRLDLCESKPPWNLTADILDGFINREDVPTDFITTHPKLNEGLSNPNNIYSIKPAIEHDGFWFKTTNPPTTIAMGMDHCVRLLMGLSLVKKLVPNISYNSQYFQHSASESPNNNINIEAQRIADRIISYMQQGGWLIFMPGKLQTFNMDIVQCVTGLYTISPQNCASLATNSPYLVPRGAYPIEFVNGLKAAGKYITGKNYADIFNSFPVLETVWETAGTPIPFNPIYSGHPGNLAQVMILAAIGNSWDVATILNNTQTALDNIDDVYYHWKVYTLLHSVLHDYSNSWNIKNSQIETLLNTAPCNGPTNNTTPWCDNNLFDIDECTSANSSDPINRHGLDYMLMFNLYCLHNQNYVSYAKILDVDLNLTGTLPIVKPIPIVPYAIVSGAESSGTLFTSAPAKYMTTGTITSNQVIENKNLSGTYTSYDLNLNSPITITITTSTNAVANVTYKSSTQIRLTTGFHAKAGVKFHALVEPIHCNASGTGYEKLASGGKEPLGNEDIALASLDKGVMYNPSGQNTEQQNIENVNTINTSNKNTTQTKQQSYNDNAFSIAPNPNSGIFEVKYNKTQGVYDANVNVSIADVTGRIVWSSLTETNKGDENNFKWDVNLVKFSKGIYSVKLQDGSNIKTGKIVVQ